MRKVYAWLGAATLFMMMSRADAANDVLKPYVVMILDTSGSMAAATGSGPTSCGKRDTRINHAVCAINNIVNSYGEMVFSLGRFRETVVGPTGTVVCDANGDQEGDVNDTLPLPSGGDVCNTQGPYCGDCDPSTGNQRSCTLPTDCTSGTCTNGFCAASVYGCKNTDAGFEVLTALVDGNNAEAAEFTDGTCNVCSVASLAGTINPEIWGVSQNTYTPLSSSLKGAQKYWEGTALAQDGSTIWPSSAPGFDPINRDPSAHVFLAANDSAACNPDAASCFAFTAETVGQCAPGNALDEDGDLRINDGCAAVNVPETACADNETACTGNNVDDDVDGTVNDGCTTVVVAESGSQCAPGNVLDEDNDGTINDGCPVVGNDNDGDGTINDGCQAWCNGPNCCCATQCRPYITILLTDGDETCTTAANTRLSAQDLSQVKPNSDAVAISSIQRSSNVVTVTTATAHPFKVGDQVTVSGTGAIIPFAGTTFIVTTTPTATTLTYAQNSANAGPVTNTGTIRHSASRYTYDIQIKPIGFGIGSPYQPIEDIAHDGGAPDVPGVNEGYYAQDEADLELAISQILADSVRAESCNERDDDCDVRIDEDYPTKGTSCAAGVGACIRSGTLVCQAGQLACSAIAGTPTTETCNLIDDDCDGFIDETVERGAECGPGAQNLTSDDVTDGFINDGCPTVGTAETNCTGNTDDDGDGFVNDGCPGVGTCTVCVPTAEICDNGDNNCDGVADQTCACIGGTRAGLTCSPGNGSADCPGGSCPAACPPGQICAGNPSFCTQIKRSCGIGVCPGVETCTGNNVYTGCTAVQDEQVETRCDGLDNDCDGVCDGFSRECSQQVAACNPNVTASCPATDSLGSPSHYTQPDTAESGTACMDALDNDLDGFINDGCPPSGTAETGAQCANAINDDVSGTDTLINDGCPVPTLPIAQNICRPGLKQCLLSANCAPNANGFQACSGETLRCGPDAANCDTCNGQDDDCDNKIDEDFVDADCSTNCGVGRTVCVNGNIVCNSTAAIGDATCNGIDDDCDNKVDEDWGDPIGPGTPPVVCKNDDGNTVACDPCTMDNMGDPVCMGIIRCINGAEECRGEAVGVEVCNCLDDDCDGKTDEDPNPTDPNIGICPGSGTAQGTCVACQCAFGCAQGEFPCPLGKKCDNSDRCSQASTTPGVVCDMPSDCTGGSCDDARFCVNDPCFNVTCQPVNGNLQTCIPKPAFPNEPQCVDTCALINDTNFAEFPPCSPGSVCFGPAGECRPDTCLTFPDRCTGSENCIDGQCVSNPCQGVTCDTGKYCLGGECLASCSDVTCAVGQRCRLGTCETDPCGKPCPFGQACNDDTGKCIEDPCKFRDCPAGQWCNPNAGLCENDPCQVNDIDCPAAGDVCRGGTCVDPNDDITIDGGGAHVTVGGGGGCNTSGGGNGLVLLLGALGLLISRRRRTVGGAL